ncbi:hypothetical protein NL676_030417 [Syzygium grande]|nr:hypothetical protein NL676_030417 [Syzygium grande]
MAKRARAHFVIGMICPKLTSTLAKSSPLSSEVCLSGCIWRSISDLGGRLREGGKGTRRCSFAEGRDIGKAQSTLARRRQCFVEGRLTLASFAHTRFVSLWGRATLRHFSWSRSTSSSLVVVSRPLADVPKLHIYFAKGHTMPAKLCRGSLDNGKLCPCEIYLTLDQATSVSPWLGWRNSKRL